MEASLDGLSAPSACFFGVCSILSLSFVVNRCVCSGTCLCTLAHTAMLMETATDEQCIGN